MRSLIAGLAVASALGGSAIAQTAPVPTPPVGTGPLAELCASSEAVAGAYCRGFLIGAGQYHGAVTARGGLQPLFCLGDAAPTVEQAQAAFAAWARANPQYAGDRAIDGVMRWAASAFPCPTPGAMPTTGRILR